MKIMNFENYDEALSSHLIYEIIYFTAFSILKRLIENGKISLETGRQANVAIAEQYGVLAYSI